MLGFTESSKCPQKGFKNRVNLGICYQNQIAAAIRYAAIAAEAATIWFRAATRNRYSVAIGRYSLLTTMVLTLI